MGDKRRPGEVRDALIAYLSDRPLGASMHDILAGVEHRLGPVAASSVRSYLRLNTPSIFERTERGHYGLTELMKTARLAESVTPHPFSVCKFKLGEIVHADCFEWLRQRDEASIHAVVTDPPYGLLEYSQEQQAKLRAGRGGVWRIPPSFDGSKRAPLPRFTVLRADDLKNLETFFTAWAALLFPVLVPGANVVVASNPLLSHIVSGALARSGLERRGELVRLVMTMRGGDRPKHAHEEFSEVSVMPRSMWEPWLLFRKPLEGRVQDTLRKWKTGGFRRISESQPFGDVIVSAPTRKGERELAPHPSLKPQAFLRKVVRSVLPLGEGVILDPFAGAGSTVAAAEAVGYKSIGIEKDKLYFAVACAAVEKLRRLRLAGVE